MTDWAKRALELGVDDAVAIPADRIVVAEWVRWKCQFGCGEYGNRLTCPPRLPPVEETRRVLRHYREGVLLRVEGAGVKDEERERRRLAEAAAALERELFLSGHYRAWTMGAGPCPFCEACQLPGPCRFPRLARPSMEGCGVDVYATVRGAGWEIEVVPTRESPFRLFALVLVE